MRKQRSPGSRRVSRTSHFKLCCLQNETPSLTVVAVSLVRREGGGLLNHSSSTPEMVRVDEYSGSGTSRSFNHYEKNDLECVPWTPEPGWLRKPPPQEEEMFLFLWGELRKGGSVLIAVAGRAVLGHSSQSLLARNYSPWCMLASGCDKSRNLGRSRCSSIAAYIISSEAATCSESGVIRVAFLRCNPLARRLHPPKCRPVWSKAHAKKLELMGVYVCWGWWWVESRNCKWSVCNTQQRYHYPWMWFWLSLLWKR